MAFDYNSCKVWYFRTSGDEQVSQQQQRQAQATINEHPKSRINVFFFSKVPWVTQMALSILLGWAGAVSLWDVLGGG